jgi:hypothetical protein
MAVGLFFRCKMLILISFLLTTTIASKSSGIPPTLLEKYSQPTYICGVLTLPSSALNDDFCDCLDGSDEPGTSACSGIKNPGFYCMNTGFKGLSILSSRVDDGRFQTLIRQVFVIAATGVMKELWPAKIRVKRTRRCIILQRLLRQR